MAASTDSLVDFLQMGCLREYTVGKMLGEGTYGSTFLLCVPKDPKQCHKVAKVIRVDGRNPGVWENATAEYVAGQVAEAADAGPRVHGQIVCVDPWGPPREVLFVILMDRFDMDLGAMLQAIAYGDTRGFDKYAVIAELEGALLRLHKSGFAHNDIKPANVGLSLEPETDIVISARFIDFGLSQPLRVTAPWNGVPPNRQPRRVSLYYALNDDLYGEAYRAALVHIGVFRDAGGILDPHEMATARKRLELSPALDDNVGLLAIRYLLKVPLDLDLSEWAS